MTWLKFAVLGASISAGLMACAPKPSPDTGKPFVVPDVDLSARLALAEAVRRGQTNGLGAPFTVEIQEGAEVTALYELSWLPEDVGSLNWKKDDPDKVLDRASIKILSVQGVSPFYDYCFGPVQHATIATRFCTKTLIAAMKAHSAS